jgi:Icc-related predicted phosphoesterase
MLCFFVSDLHGRTNRYEALWKAISDDCPDAVFLGGDLMPMWLEQSDFVPSAFRPGFERLRHVMGDDYPRIFVILGNDDPQAFEELFQEGERDGLWEYIHGRMTRLGDYSVYGYSHVPPTPFQLKDWERYDVSRYVDPGCVSPEEGQRSVSIENRVIRYATIAADLEELVGEARLDRAIMLFHGPPYGGMLDRAALDGKTIDSVPLDNHVGSIAVQRFIAARQPRLTLHGHVHESARLTGSWQEKSTNTVSLSAAHDGPELALVRFDPEVPTASTRELLD